MITSKNGAPILTGHALEKIKEQVEKRFSEAREAGATSLVPSKPKPELGTLSAMVVAADESSAAHPHMRLAVIPESKPLRPLAEVAAPLLREIRVTGMPHRRNTACCWDIGDEPRVEDVPKLFDAALVALGYPPQKPLDEPSPRTCLAAEPEKPSIWKRDIFGKRAR